MSGIYEKLSALMDDESDDFETRRLIQESNKDPEVADTWRRFHLARSLMREKQIDSKIDISASVMDELVRDEAITEYEKQPTRRTGFLAASTSMAVAASVTFAVLLGVQNFSTSPDRISPVVQAGVIESRVNPNGLLPTSLLPAKAAAAELGDSIGIIRVSNDLQPAIEFHQRVLAAGPDLSGAAVWSSEQDSKSASQQTGQPAVKLYEKNGSLISLAVSNGSELDRKPGVLVQGDLLAYGEQRGDHFVSVVGHLSLDEAQKVVSSVSSAE